jgi:hypothetical protein
MVECMLIGKGGKSMTNIGYDSNWREQYKSMKILSESQIKLLEEGPKSLSQSWIVGAMYSDWKRIKGIKDPEPPDCQSSFKEWEDSIGSGLKEI